MFCPALFICLMINIINGDTILENAQKYLKNIDDAASEDCFNFASAQWAYSTNIDDDTTIKYAAAASEEFNKSLWNEIKNFPLDQIKDQDIRRQFNLYSNIEELALSKEKLSEYNEIITEMARINKENKICQYENRENCDIDAEAIVNKSVNEEELSYYFTESMKAGEKIRPFYPQLVSLYNEAAALNGFQNAAEMWLSEYENVRIEEEFKILYQQILPLYKELFAYVRRKLRQKFGRKLISKRGPIPLHLLRTLNGSGTLWTNIADLSMPYPDIEQIDITNLLKKQKYKPMKMFRTAEEFFTSISLDPMNAKFWDNSMLVEPRNRRVDCFPGAVDFCNKKDFRIKMCTKVDENNFFTIYHEMGIIEYFMQYKELPYCYRDGANPGFLEAIGDLIVLSVNTPSYLHKIGILPEVDNSREADINFLYQLALKKIVFLPFSYALELWQLNVFRNEITPKNYNCKYWHLVHQLVGLEPPMKRNEQHFDPGVRKHVINNTPFISYFVVYFLQFQFHEALCTKTNQYDPNNPERKPLHHCNLYQNKEAGTLLKEIMKLGRSKPWPDVLKSFTGSSSIDAGPILRYFAPLKKWLEEENMKSNEHVGWETTDFGTCFNL